MASSTTVPPSATTPATSPQDFILQYMKDTQIDPVHDEISRAPNAYTIFKKYYNLSFTAATVDAWNNLGAYERGLFIDAEEAAKALHKEMYPGYELKPKSTRGPQVKRSHASKTSVMPVNFTAPSTSTAPAPSVSFPEHSIQQDYHTHHYGYTDEMSAAIDEGDLAGDLLSSYEMAAVAPYLFEGFEQDLIVDSE